MSLLGFDPGYLPATTTTKPDEQQGRFGDVIDSFQAGAASGLGGIFDFVGADGLAKSLYRISDEQRAQMSDRGREAMAKQMFTEDANGDVALGDGFTDLDTWLLQMSNVAGQFLPTAIPGGLAAKAATTAFKLGEKGAKVAQAVGMGATGGSSATGLAMEQARDEVNAMPDEVLAQSALFKRTFLDLDASAPELDDAQKWDMAKTKLSEQVASEVKSDPKALLANFAASAVGDPIIGRALMGARLAKSGVLRSALVGGVTEGTTEAIQAGTSQYSVDSALSSIDQRDPTAGVKLAALNEGVIGAGFGGTAGAIGGALNRNKAADPIRETNPSIAGAMDASAEQEQQRKADIAGLLTGPEPIDYDQPTAARRAGMGDTMNAGKFGDEKMRNGQATGRAGEWLGPEQEFNDVSGLLERPYIDGETAPTVNGASRAAPQPNLADQRRDGEWLGPERQGRSPVTGLLAAPFIDGESSVGQATKDAMAAQPTNLLGNNGAIYADDGRRAEQRQRGNNIGNAPTLENKLTGDAEKGDGSTIYAPDNYSLKTKGINVKGNNLPYASPKEALMSKRARQAKREGATIEAVDLGNGGFGWRISEVSEGDVTEKIDETDLPATSDNPQQEENPLDAGRPTLEMPDLPPTKHKVSNLEVVEAPINEITLSADVPQFKSGANASGIVEPLGGKFDRAGVAPIQVWVRSDGRKEVISGRHRLDLARRSGESTIPAQYHYEDDGFGVKQASMMDAMLNIREGQGKVKDYVDFIQGTGITQEEANAQGILARATGKRAYSIATKGTDALIASHRADEVSDEAATRIADAAPNHEALQAVGIRAIQQGKSIAIAENLIKAVASMTGNTPSSGDLFGFDDSAMKEAEAMARAASSKQAEIQRILSAIHGAAKRPDLAAAEGVNIRDPKSINDRITALKAEKAQWDNWHTDSALVAQIRAGLSAKPASKPAESGATSGVKSGAIYGPKGTPTKTTSANADDLLTGYSEAELAAEQKRKDEETKKAAEAKRLEDERIKADSELGDFTLTGSDRISDIGAAAGQDDLFAPAPNKPDETGEVDSLTAEILAMTDEQRKKWRDVTKIIYNATIEPQGVLSRKAKIERARREVDKLSASAIVKQDLYARLDSVEPATDKPKASANTIFTEEAAEEARKKLRALLGIAHSGINPEILQAGLTLAGYHIEKGARSFAAFAQAMIGDMGETIKPYLKSWYMGIKYDPRAAAFEGMDSAAAVDSADIDSLVNPPESAPADSKPDAEASADKPASEAVKWFGTMAKAQAWVDKQPNAEEFYIRQQGSSRFEIFRNSQLDPAALDNQVDQVKLDEDRLNNNNEAGNEPTKLGTNGGKTPQGVPADKVQGTEGFWETEDAHPQGGATNVQGDKRTGDDGLQSGGSLGDRQGESSSTEAGNAGIKPAGVTNPAPQMFTITAETGIGQGGAKTKFKNNIAAIRILKQLTQEGRNATPDEQAKLALYVGWGGIPQAFLGANGNVSTGWEKEAAELKGLLTQEEYAAARRSTQDAHYTSFEVVSAIWSAVSQFGFTGGKVLEPSIGSGNFIGLMPVAERSRSQIIASELDHITGGIAKQLYPSAKISAPKGFQDLILPDNHFDLAIGNPPFGSQTLYDGKRRHLSKFSIHNYFFAKSLDALAPNGVLAMVVSNFLMDANSTAARQYLADRAELIGAIRLPNNAFSKNAGTEVTTDIIFLRKLREGETADQSWVNTGYIIDDRGINIPLNNYFIDNKHMMLGDFGAYGSMYSPDAPALVAKPGQDTTAMLNEAIAKLPKAFMDKQGKVIKQDYEVSATSVESTKVGSMFLKDGVVHIRQEDNFGEAVSEPVVYPNEKAKDRIIGLIKIRDVFTDLRKAQLTVGISDAELGRLRKLLNKVYDDFVKANGPINADANKRLFRDDPTWPQVAALEDSFDKGITAAVAKKTGEQAREPSARKAAVFTTRTQSPYKPPESAHSAVDALSCSLSEFGRVDMAFMAGLYGKSQGAIQAELGGLIFESTPGVFHTRDEYLSGNVREKLAHAERLAEQDGKFYRNVEALKAVLPKDIAAVDIDVKPGAPWLPESVMTAFVKSLIGDKQAAARYNAFTASWSVTGYGELSANKSYGTDRMTPAKIIEAAANQKQIIIRDTLDDGTSVVNEQATTAANEKVEKVKAEFRQWIWADDARRNNLVRIYNDTYNTNVARKYDGSHLTFPGKVDTIKLRPHQANAVWRINQAGTTLLDHVVGAGKTFTIIAGAMEMRRTGRAKKPMIVVPNHLVDQWAEDFIKLYPGANVLMTTKKDFEKGNRKRLFARIATGDWDAVIVAHSAFGKVEMDPQFEAGFIQQQVDDMEIAIQNIRAVEGKKSQSVKQIEKQKERLQEKLKKLFDSQNKDDNLTFGELGIDALFVDEAHEFKNLGFATGMTRVAGLGNPTGSQKSADMFMKVRYVLEQTGGNNVVFATGTPISNTMAELYTMQRYLDYPSLQQQGIAHFDAWARTFGEVVSDWELSPSGTYKLNSRFAKFVNLPELMQRYLTFADVVNRDDVKLPTPVIKTGKPVNIVVDRSPDQAFYIGEPSTDENGVESYPEGCLIWRSEHIPKRPQKGDDNMLSIMSDARKAALDMRMIDPGYADFSGSKTNKAANEIMRLYNKFNEDKGTQLVFIDLSTPKGAKAKEQAELRELIDLADAGDEKAIAKLESMSPDELAALDGDFSVYDDLKLKLIKKGIPEAEIAFIHDAKTELQKGELFGKVKSGRVRVLLGSTAKMGAGMNVQERLVALHHLDAPWRPSDLEQREGRIIRQGNRLAFNPDGTPVKGFEIEIMRYATKNTLDSRMWQTIESKARFIEQVRKGNAQERSIEDVGGEAANAAEMKAASSGNPLILEEMDLRQKIRKLEQLQSEHNREQFSIRDSIGQIEKYLPVLIDSASNIEIDAKAVAPDMFAIKVANSHFDKRADAGEALKAQIGKAKNGEAVAHYAGFPVKVSKGRLTDSVTIDIVGRETYSFDVNDPANADPAGLITRVTNAVARIPSELERVRAEIERLQSELPKLKKQLASFLKLDELASLKSRHALIIDELKPKKASKDDGATDVDPKKSGADSNIVFSKHAKTKVRKGVSRKDAQAKIDALWSKLNGAAGMRVELFDTQEDFYNHFNMSAEQRARYQGETINGAYDHKRNVVYLVLANAVDMADFTQTLHHEVVGHGGLHQVIGKEKYQQFIDMLTKTRNKPAFAKLWAQLDKDYKGMSEAVKAEELFTHFVQSQPEIGTLKAWWFELKKWLRRQLEDLGIIKANISRNDMEDMMQAIVRGFDKRKQRTDRAQRVLDRGGKMTDNLRFSQSNQDDGIGNVTDTPEFKAGEPVKIPKTKKTIDWVLANFDKLSQSDVESVMYQLDANGDWDGMDPYYAKKAFKTLTADLSTLEKQVTKYGVVVYDIDSFINELNAKSQNHYDTDFYNIGAVYRDDIIDSLASYGLNQYEIDNGMANIRFSKTPDHIIDYATHKPIASDLRLQRARSILGDKEFGLDINFVSDDFGHWISIEENAWHGYENLGQISNGVAFINGELYEIDPSALFYRDESPYWSPVVSASTQSLANLYKKLTGKSYPILKADGSDPEEFRKLIQLKSRKGFEYIDEVFQASASNDNLFFSKSGSITDTTEFKRWFGDSKVVDENGEPLVVYHGTMADISEFSDQLLGTSTGAPSAEMGFFFAGDAEVANYYALGGKDRKIMFGLMTEKMVKHNWNRAKNQHWQAPGPNVIPAYLSMQNPYIYDMKGKVYREQTYAKVIADAKRLGHDGVIIKNTFDANERPLIPALHSLFNKPSDIYVAFHKAQIKSAIGNNGRFDGDNPDIRFSMAMEDDARTAKQKLGLEDEAAQSLADAIKAKYHDTADTLKQSSFWSRLNEGLFDGLHGIKKAEEAAGITDVNKMGYVSARLASGLSDILHGMFHYGAPMWKDGIIQRKQNTKGLLEVFGMLPDGQLNNWLAWMGANRAKQLMAEGRENNLTQADINELLALAKGNEVLFEQVRKEYNKINSAVLDVAQGAGLISSAQRAGFDEEYYVPFFREIEVDPAMQDIASIVAAPYSRKGIASQSANIKALKGGKQSTKDLLENIILRHSTMIDASLKNKAMLEVAANLDGTGFMNKVNPHVFSTLSQKQLNGISRVKVLRDGKVETYEVLDPALLRGLIAVNDVGSQSLFNRMGRSAKRFLTTGITLSPDFIVKNFVRDAAHAWMINKDDFKFGVDSVKGLKKAFSEDEAYRDLIFSGAAFQGGYVHGADPEAAAQQIRRALSKKGLSGKQIDNYMGTIVTNGKKLIEKYRNASDKVENANRLSTYEAALAKGKSKRQAAFEAKDLMDYSMKGNFKLIATMIDFLPFFNARLQGMYKLARASGAEGNDRILKVLSANLAMKGLYVAAFSVLLAATNDDDERYQQLPDWDKDANWHFWLGDDHFRIPKPFELGIIFGTFPERLFGAGMGSQSTSDLGRSVGHAVFNTLAMNPIPQFALPVAEVAFNKSMFKGSPIEGMGDELKMPGDRYSANTSDIARELGQAFNLSPKKIEHLVNGYAGTLGAYTLGMADIVARQMLGIEKADTPIGRYPVIKAFYTGDDEPTSTYFQTEFYKSIDAANQAYGSYKRAAEERDSSRLMDVLEDNRQQLGVRVALNRVQRQVSAINKQAAMINSSNLSGAQKREQLDALTRQKNAIFQRAYVGFNLREW